MSLDGYSDSDWAQNEDKKSRSSVYVEANGCCLLKSTRRQGVIARSSAEAEFYAATATASEVCQLKELMEWLGFRVRARLFMDSSAARGIAAREGAGRVRHIAVHTLWLQQIVKRKVLEISTIGTLLNPADLGTKVHPRQRLEWLRQRVGIEVPSRANEDDGGRETGEAELALNMIRRMLSTL